MYRKIFRIFFPFVVMSISYLLVSGWAIEGYSWIYVYYGSMLYTSILGAFIVYSGLEKDNKQKKISLFSGVLCLIFFLISKHWVIVWMVGFTIYIVSYIILGGNKKRIIIVYLVTSIFLVGYLVSRADTKYINCMPTVIMPGKSKEVYKSSFINCDTPNYLLDLLGYEKAV